MCTFKFNLACYFYVTSKVYNDDNEQNLDAKNAPSLIIK